MQFTVEIELRANNMLRLVTKKEQDNEALIRKRIDDL